MHHRLKLVFLVCSRFCLHLLIAFMGSLLCTSSLLYNLILLPIEQRHIIRIHSLCVSVSLGFIYCLSTTMCAGTLICQLYIIIAICAFVLLTDCGWHFWVSLSVQLCTVCTLCTGPKSMSNWVLFYLLELRIFF